MITIYSLSCPITGNVRYVGQTIQNVKNRYSSHISASKHGRKKDYCHSWIKSLLNKNLKPILNIIEITDDVEREVYWINYYKKSNNNFTNHRKGGILGNIKPSYNKEKKGKPVYIFSKDKQLIKQFISTNHFGRYYNIKNPSRIVKNNIILQNGFVPSYNKNFNNIKPKLKKNQQIIVIKNNKLIKECNSILCLSKFLDINYTTLIFNIKRKGLIGLNYNDLIIEYKYKIEDYYDIMPK